MATKGKVRLKQPKGSNRRKGKKRLYEYTYLIVCEDERTEKRYFEQFQDLFPEDKVSVCVLGSGRQWLQVVEYAITKKAEEEERLKKQIDQLWVVFDVDDAHLDKLKSKSFDNALKIAAENNFQVAYSNDAFEIWLLLHLEDVYCLHCKENDDYKYPPISRKNPSFFTIERDSVNLEIIKENGFYDSNITDSCSMTHCIYARLEGAIRQHPNYSEYIYVHNASYISQNKSIDKSIINNIKKYRKEQKDIIEVIREIGDEDQAIKRAEALLQFHKDKRELLSNPSTRVHILVKSLRASEEFHNRT